VVGSDQPPNGLRSSSPRRLAGEMRRDMWSVIGTGFTAPGSFSACGPWAFGIGRSRHSRHGKMDTLKGSSARSDVIPSPISLFSASSIFAISCARIKDITMRDRTHLALCKDAPIPRAVRPVAVSSSRPFWVDCTINKGGFEFPTGTGAKTGEVGSGAATSALLLVRSNRRSSALFSSRDQA
jgi:hypothetical protein